MALRYQTVASSQMSGALIGSLTAGEAAQLSANFAVNRAAFDAQARALVNGQVQATEQNEPEGQRNVLTLQGWGGKAPAAASALNREWAQGKLTITPWPEYPQTIAWAQGNDTLVVRWRKEGPVLWLIIGALIVVVGYILYRTLRHGSYTLQTANTASSGGNPVSLNGGLKLLGVQWYWWLGGAGALAVTPWAYRKIVAIKQDEVRSIAANRAIQEAKQ